MVMSSLVNTFTIRTAQATDAAPLAALGARVFASTYGTVIEKEALFHYLRENLSATAVAADLARPETYYHVATDGDELLGFVKLEETTAPLCVIADRPLEIVRLYVAHEHRQQGIGRMLLTQALETAVKLNYPAVWVCVWENHQQSIDFYQHNGFEPRGKNSLFVDTVAFRDYVLEKGL